ncbi:MAG: hypothetical protein WCG31_04240 [Deltaproteobacteria bacterium]
MTSKPSLRAIMEAVEAILGSGNVTKNATIYLCHKYSGAGLKEIGEIFGAKESAISQASRRFTQVLERDKELQKQVEEVRKRLKM